MDTVYFVDSSGTFLGGFSGCTPDVLGAVSVPSAPEDGRMVWDFVSSSWVMPAALAVEQHNAPLLSQLRDIDFKTIRSLREGDIQRISEYEAQASLIRSKLIK